ncbi:hypothetical protein WR25_23654 [Diploscapter pachys]|uniref:rRNA biogenesis protein RRP36 n=1 Tax=Diploscapter pachys TaxID=2018661 RepID=A0A2A2M1W7_9BILA|nr:hypothetical protein WR25_23654 [Diploscapter pachys]
MEPPSSSDSPIGRRTFPKKVTGGPPAQSPLSQAFNSKKAKGKHRPKEISSKRPVGNKNPFFKNGDKKNKRWDPRFDPRAGEFRPHVFQEDYEFLDEIRQEEEKGLQKALKSSERRGNEDRAEEIKMTLKKMKDRRKTTEEQKRQRETRRQLEEENVERMLKGEKPIFKTKAQLRQLDAEVKFTQLKKDGKLQKYMERKLKNKARVEKFKAKKEAENMEQKGKPQRLVDDFNAKYGYVN